MSILKFNPIYQERVWGGRKLEQAFGRSLPASKPIGESWEMVDRPEAQSIVANGPYFGKTLRELVRTAGESLFGPASDPDKPFPVLVKWLDCSKRLSLQVHPPAEIASILGGEPKAEAWYVADADEGAALLVGLKKNVARQEFEQALANETLEELVHRIPSRSGDSLLVESGRMHAIDAGNLILEIQQNSDTTYRVYDWGRVGLDGQPRQLHVAQSLQCIDFQDFEPQLLSDNENLSEQVLVDCEEFRIRRMRLAPDDRISFPDGCEPSLIHVVSGQITAGEITVLEGETGLIPFSDTVDLMASRATTVLITDRFLLPDGR
jgi:mannose-6-phosphate isomerase